MWSSAVLPLFAASVLAQYQTGSATSSASASASVSASASASVSEPVASSTSVPTPDDDGKYEISAEGIRAQFIPYGASISNLFINDTNGIERDIVLGFDNASYYSIDPVHPHLGGVPGKIE